jgi:hypothetical protein
VVSLLNANLREEKAADKKLNGLAEGKVNRKATGHRIATQRCEQDEKWRGKEEPKWKNEKESRRRREQAFGGTQEVAGALVGCLSWATRRRRVPL